MRGIAAASVLAFVLAAPLAPMLGAAKTRDHSRTCQAGKSSATKSTLLGSKQRFAVVACEQPPKSNLTLAGSVAKSTAAALSVLG